MDRSPAQPSAIVVDAVKLIEPGRALDLACGRGRNGVFLVEQGWSVVGIDGSAAVMEGMDPRVTTHVLDLERNTLPFENESFDMVCIIHFLHRPLFAEARRVTRPGSVVVSAIHTTRSTMNPKYTVAIGELRSFFSDWEILVDREDLIAEIVARKPVRYAAVASPRLTG
jgi:tellurite methyltransferase